MIADPDITYHADRARAEAVRAIAEDREIVAAIHGELCLLHCGRVIATLLQSGAGAARG